MPATRPLIVAYHAVDSTWASELAVSEDALAAHADYFRSRGYVGLTLRDAEERRLNGTLPERAVVFTFDDGYVSTLRAAAILERCGFPGTVFVVTDFVDGERPLRWARVENEAPEHMLPLGWDGLRQLTSAGWEVGSHTASHPLLTEAEDETLDRELASSRARIIDALGRCDSLAYPYGQADRRVAAAAGRAGYSTAVMLTGIEVADERWRRPRLGLTSADRGVRLRVKLSKAALGARRSAPAKLARRARRRRAWIPAGEPRRG